MPIPASTRTVHVESIDPRKRKAACEFCGARNFHDPDTPGRYEKHIHALHMGGVRTDLCGTCLEHVRRTVGEYQSALVKDEDPANDWRRDLLTKVTNHITAAHDPLLPGRLQRLDDCLMAIPDYADYAALVGLLSGAWPHAPRPGRPDDALLPDDGDTVPSGFRAEKAIMFLKKPVRAGYVLTGGTDLNAEFPPDTARWLESLHVHVVADLARFPTGRELFDVPGITPDLVAEIWPSVLKARQDEEPDAG